MCVWDIDHQKMMIFFGVGDPSAHEDPKDICSRATMKGFFFTWRRTGMQGMKEGEMGFK